MPGQTITGTGLYAGTTILSYKTGSAVFVGSWDNSAATITVESVTSGYIAIGQTISGTDLDSATTITAFGTGTGLLGTYTISKVQTSAGSR